jgi:hypothetical protein
MRPKRSDSLTALFALPHPEFRQFSHGLHKLRTAAGFLELRGERLDAPSQVSRQPSG